MKNTILLLFLLGTVSCTSPKVLKTDTQQDIDLSGRWNSTDAEIATSELFNSLITSTWLKKHQAGNNLKPRVEILEFESNFKDGGDKLKHFFSQYIKANSLIDLIENQSEKIPELHLTGKIIAQEFITDSDNYIDYNITAQLKNMDKEIVWEDKTIIKKYIKD